MSKPSLVKTKQAHNVNHCRVEQETSILIPGILFR